MVKKLIFIKLVAVLFIFVIAGCSDENKTSDYESEKWDSDNETTEESDFPGGNDDSGFPNDEDDDSDDNDSGKKDEDEIDFGSGFCSCFGFKYKLPEIYAEDSEWCMKDDDDDGISNCIEAPNGVLVDTNSDGTADYLNTDSDGDGIPDRHECPELLGEKDDDGDFLEMPYCRDTDGDGVPDYRDTDSDGDDIPDRHECPDFYEQTGCRDTDGDEIPDYLDTDSDGDGIPDHYECPAFDPVEGCRDTDGDGVPDYLDLDSDGDGFPDSEECPYFDEEEECVDTDGDGVPDYLDLDSDGDGILDEDELYCDNIDRNCRTYTDCDEDGVDDNTELAAGTDPCVDDAELYEEHFYVILPYEGPEENEPLEFGTEIQKLDFVISMDLSGSMSDARDNLKQDVVDVVINGIEDIVPDPAFSISSFSNIENSPYFMDQTITKDSTAIQNAVNTLDGEGGGTIESQYEAMYQAATGAGFDGELLKFDSSACFSNPIACAINVDSYYNSYADVFIDPKDCTGGLGNIGGACFREHALPVLMLVTDEQLYDINNDIISDAGITAYRYKWNESKPDKGHYEKEVINAFNDINAKFIGVIGSGLGDLFMDIKKRMKKIADGTNSRGMAGEYFIYEVGYFGTGLSDDIVGAVDEILHNIQMDIDTANESVANVHAIDTTQFIKSVTASHSNPPEAYESKSGNTFKKVKPKTDLFFDVVFENTTFEPETTHNTLFRAKIHVFGEGAILDTREVYIIVPGKESKPGGVPS
ncbi:MAG: hypothetical protein R6W70_08275 [bacterium]